MCGLLGWLTTENSMLPGKVYRKGIDVLFSLSESRGREASGACFVTDTEMCLLKAPIRAQKMIQSRVFKECVDDILLKKQRLVMGHARMVTNGNAANQRNNQPVIRGDLVCIHNGIIVNAENLWQGIDAKRESEVDTEVFLALLEKYQYQNHFLKAFRQSLDEIEGSLSIALLDRKGGYLFFYTNTGSLYLGMGAEHSDILFSSERYILERMMKMEAIDKNHTICHIRPGEAYFVSLKDGNVVQANEESWAVFRKFQLDRTVSIHTIDLGSPQKAPIPCTNFDVHAVASLMQVDLGKIHSLKRCTKCLLPETFPGISFDADGVCSVCHEYIKNESKGGKAFLEDIAKESVLENEYDCIAPISGGRDSCYILHYLVKELHLKPVAYTYDWGLVTDLARRNIQRMCAALGVEHILISADIKMKRENVRKNVEAWLKRPRLGTVPLFMAGDKQFFYYAQLLKKQMKIGTVIFGMNRLEETRFKARFIGLGSVHGTNDTFQHFTTANKFQMLVNYGKEFLMNPSFINSSLLDSFFGYLSYFAVPQNYLRFFDYIAWNQKEIEDTLIQQYNWETATETKETWRIGDGTASFYNYIYYRLAGFTEFDTFRSNQIREGMLTREEAIESLDEANAPAVDGFLWYCRTIGIDPVKTLEIINAQRPLYVM